MPPDPAWNLELLDALQQPIWTMRADGTILRANAFWHRYTGIGPSAPPGMFWDAAMHPEDADRVRAEWDGARASENPFELEYRLRRADGDWRWHLARFARLPGTDLPAPWSAIAIDIEERRRARNALRASEARYRDAVALADDIIYTLRLDGTVAEVNPAVERVLGYTREELIDTVLERLVVPEQLPRTRAMLARKLEGEESSSYELDLMARDGHRVTLEINTRLARGEGMEPVIHGIARDITSRRQRIRQAELSAAIGTALTTQRALVDQLQACAQALVDHLGAAFARIWLIDEDDPALLRLEASAGLYTHLDGEHSRIRMGEFKIGRIAARRQPLLTNAVSEDPEIRDQAWARREGMVAFAGFPILLGERVLGVVGLFARHTLDDATRAVLRSVVDAIAVAIDRDRVERARDAVLVREHEARVWAELTETRYRNLFEGVADAIFVTDDRQQVIDANAAALALVGYERGDLIGHSLEDLLAVPFSWTEEQRAELLSAGHWQGELELRRRDRSVVPVEARTTVVELPTGVVYLSAARDITERRHLARIERDFLAMVTHDLRTPLTSIKGWLQVLLRRPSLTDRDQVVVRRSLEQVERMAHLINDLADVLRIEAGHLRLHPQTVDLVTLVREHVAVIQEHSARHQIEVAAPDGAITGRWDRQRIGQVLDNLLTNAVKYSPLGGLVRVEVASSDGASTVRVIDRGIGVLPDHLPLLFERFYRAGATGAGGLGLGLYITRMLVEAHGGRIAADSKPGAGSTFTVTLPLAPPPGTTAGDAIE